MLSDYDWLLDCLRNDCVFEAKEVLESGRGKGILTWAALHNSVNCVKLILESGICDVKSSAMQVAYNLTTSDEIKKMISEHLK